MNTYIYIYTYVIVFRIACLLCKKLHITNKFNPWNRNQKWTNRGVGGRKTRTANFDPADTASTCNAHRQDNHWHRPQTDRLNKDRRPVTNPGDMSRPCGECRKSWRNKPRVFEARELGSPCPKNSILFSSTIFPAHALCVTCVCRSYKMVLTAKKGWI